MQIKVEFKTIAKTITNIFADYKILKSLFSKTQSYHFILDKTLILKTSQDKRRIHCD